MERNFPGDSFDLGGLRPGSYRFEISRRATHSRAARTWIIASGQQGTEGTGQPAARRHDHRPAAAAGGQRAPSSLRDSDWDPAGHRVHLSTPATTAS